jgi:hypothetical protein
LGVKADTLKLKDFVSTVGEMPVKAAAALAALTGIQLALMEIARNAIEGYIDMDLYEAWKEREEQDKKALQDAANFKEAQRKAAEAKARLDQQAIDQAQQLEQDNLKMQQLQLEQTRLRAQPWRRLGWSCGSSGFFWTPHPWRRRASLRTTRTSKAPSSSLRRRWTHTRNAFRPASHGRWSAFTPPTSSSVCGCCTRSVRVGHRLSGSLGRQLQGFLPPLWRILLRLLRLQHRHAQRPA